MAPITKTGLKYLWSQLKIKMSNYQSLAPGVAIPSGADLDDYVEPGTYYVGSAAMAASLTNSPTTGAGYMLTVVKTYGAASTGLWRTQIAMTATWVCYIRYRDAAGAWIGWKKLVFTDTTYAEVTAGAAGLMSPEDKAKLDGFGGADEYALKSDVAAVKVGGRNLLLHTGSSKLSEMAFVGSTQGGVEYLADGNGYGVLQANGVGSAYMAWFYATNIKAAVDEDMTVEADLEAGDYVFACDLNTNIVTSKSLPITIQLRLFKHSNGAYANAATIFSLTSTAVLKSYSLFDGSEEWYRAEYHVSIPETIAWAVSNISTHAGEDYIVAVGFVVGASVTAGQYFRVRRAKFERGTVATDWTPAPEDKADAPVFVSAALSVAGWTDNTDEETKERYPKVYALAVSGATSAHGAECCIAPASMEEAVVRGLCPSASVTDGCIVFYAQEVPTAAIAVQYRLI